MNQLLRWGLLGLLLGLGALWFLSRPQPLPASALPEHKPDLANGEVLFHAAGCGSCHGQPDGERARGLLLSGGLVMTTPAGRFHVPNISPHETAGIGAWSALDFVNAMHRGLSPDGRHYYPAFPYTSYQQMTLTDLLDLKAYLDQLPPSAQVVPEHELGFPWQLHRGIGLWKRLFLGAEPALAELPSAEPQDLLLRGRYLVEGPGHCGACHTPRTWLLAEDPARPLQGAPAADGKGRVPGISAEQLADWSVDDLSYYFEAGVDPDFDVVGGSMVAVQENLARLPARDRQAIALYLKTPR